jgi:hypothetical protein
MRCQGRRLVPECTWRSNVQPIPRYRMYCMQGVARDGCSSTRQPVESRRAPVISLTVAVMGEEGCGAVRQHLFFHSCASRLLSSEYVTAQWPLCRNGSLAMGEQTRIRCRTTTTRQGQQAVHTERQEERQDGTGDDSPWESSEGRDGRGCDEGRNGVEVEHL